MSSLSILGIPPSGKFRITPSIILASQPLQQQNVVFAVTFRSLCHWMSRLLKMMAGAWFPLRHCRETVFHLKNPSQ